VNHRYIVSLIHKFNQDVDPKKPNGERDDIIVISDEAHRTQSGRLARDMRIALPNAAFIGLSGTPLFKQDEITKRIFGGYVSQYNFKRSEEDGATVKLIYENRDVKLGLAYADLNERIAEKIEPADLDPDQAALLDKLLGKDYQVVTADESLDKIASDFVEHCATRWKSGKFAPSSPIWRRGLKSRLNGLMNPSSRSSSARRRTRSPIFSSGTLTSSRIGSG
jgi:type I restriction enzyme R subunit